MIFFFLNEKKKTRKIKREKKEKSRRSLEVQQEETSLKGMHRTLESLVDSGYKLDTVVLW